MNWAYWFFGTGRVEAVGNTVDIINALEYYDIEYTDMKSEENKVSFTVLLPYIKKLKRLRCVFDGSITIVSKKGLPPLTLKILHRPGLILGCIIFVICMSFYGDFVFDIKVNGNERLSEKYVLDALKSQNFSIGSYIPDVDFNHLSNEICLEYGDISWLFINMMGNVAYVELREYQKDEITKEDFNKDDRTDLIATHDGIIYRYEIESGIAKVSVGQTALKGEILVSGWEKGEKSDYYGRSKGMVFAKTYHTFDINIPREKEVEREIERIEVEKWIEILGFRINLSKKGSNFDGSCDIIEESWKITLPGGAELPIILTKRYEVKTAVEKVSLSDEQLKDTADRMLNEEIQNSIPAAEVLSIQRSEEITTEGYTVRCGIYCILNIAKEVEAKRTEEPPINNS